MSMHKAMHHDEIHIIPGCTSEGSIYMALNLHVSTCMFGSGHAHKTKVTSIRAHNLG